MSWTQFATPPLAFTGLLVGLWAYKCLAMIVFQNKIIYMPSIPPFSRSEKISDYKYPRTIEWREEQIRSLDGTRLALAIGTAETPDQAALMKNPTTIIAYFQGNASSLPPRLPGLSSILTDLKFRAESKHDYILVALSYRGFWNSRGRPSQKGIEKDAQAFMTWLQTFSRSQSPNVQLVVWGQSIGAAIAASATASWLQSTTFPGHEPHATIKGVILETPFTTMKEMLITMYPQKWLPYRYLWPFLRSTWDNGAALDNIAQSLASSRPRILIMQAGRDELIPPEHSTLLQERCSELGLDARWLSIPGAYHTTAASLPSGRQAIVGFIDQTVTQQADGKSNRGAEAK